LDDARRIVISLSVSQDEVPIRGSGASGEVQHKDDLEAAAAQRNRAHHALGISQQGGLF
jgi:hypothetical protein